MSRLCFRLPTPAPPTASFFSPPVAAPAAAAAATEGEEGALESEAASFSADWTLLSSGERGGSALLGLEIWRASGGDECSLTGKDWPTAAAAAWPGSGEGER